MAKVELPCAFFAKGLCPRGDACIFVHEKIQSSSLCRFWSTGTCRYGANCRNLHEGSPPLTEDALAATMQKNLSIAGPANDASDEQVLEVAFEPCRAWLKGTCRFGEKCWYPHEYPPANAIEEPDDGSSTTFGENHTVLSSTKIVLSHGGAIRSICTGFESQRITISNVPSNAKDHHLQALAAMFENCKVLRRDLDKEKATLHFEDPSHATAALAIVDGYAIKGVEVSAKLDLSSTTSAGNIRFESSLAFNFPRPSKTATVRYANTAAAYAAIGGLLGVTIWNHKLHAFRPGASFDNPYRTIVKIQNIPVGKRSYDVENVLEFVLGVGGHVTSMERTGRVDEDKVEELLTPILERYGSLQHLRIQPEIPGDRLCRGWAVFSDQDSTASAYDGLQRDPPTFNDAPLRSKLNLSVSYLIRREQYDVQSDAITWINENIPDTLNLKINDQAGRKEVILRIFGDTFHTLKQFKGQVDTALAGKTWKRNNESAPVWHEYFMTAEGVEAVKEIAEDTRTYIHGDILRRQVVIFGTENRQARAQRHLESLLNRQALQTHTVPITRALFGYFKAGGLHRLKEKLPSAGLNEKRQCISAQGEGVAVLRALHTAIDAAKADLRQKMAHTEVTCPACFSEVADPITLPCGHAYCMDCISHYVVTSAHSRDGPFPITCIGNDASCEQPIPLDIFHRFLKSEEYRIFVENAFHFYIRARPNVFRFCPTPNCAQIYRIPEGVEESAARRRKIPLQWILRCPECFVRICTVCHQEHHEGMTCEEYEEEKRGGDRLFRRWMDRRGAKECPGCRSAIERTEGCNHVQCTSCKAHFCWVCLHRSATSDEIYGHLRSVHGGIGLD